MNSLDVIGLSQREQACYKALLSLGSSSVGGIIEKTDIPSSKIYEVLSRLAKKGLVTHISKGKVKHYQAKDPSVLIRLLDEHRRSLEAELPRLMALKSEKHSAVELIEGQSALFDELTHLISQAKSGQLYLVFALDEKTMVAELFYKNIGARRKEKRLDVRVLRNDAYRKEKHAKNIRYTQFHLPQGVTIVGDTVLMASWSQTPITIKIQNPQIAEQWRRFFLELWKETR